MIKRNFGSIARFKYKRNISYIHHFLGFNIYIHHGAAITEGILIIVIMFNFSINKLNSKSFVMKSWISTILKCLLSISAFVRLENNKSYVGKYFIKSQILKEINSESVWVRLICFLWKSCPLCERSTHYSFKIWNYKSQQQSNGRRYIRSWILG